MVSRAAILIFAALFALPMLAWAAVDSPLIMPEVTNIQCFDGTTWRDCNTFQAGQTIQQIRADCELPLYIRDTDIYGNIIALTPLSPTNSNLAKLYAYNNATQTVRAITPTYREINKQNTNGVFLSADVYAEKIVYSDKRNGNFDVFLYDYATDTEIQITSGAEDEYNPRIWGDIIVYVSDIASGGEIYYYRISTGTSIRITTNVFLDQDPDVYGQYIVWGANYPQALNCILPSGDLRYIMQYDLSTTTTSTILNADEDLPLDCNGVREPRVYEDRIVFSVRRQQSPGFALFYAVNRTTGAPWPMYVNAPGCTPQSPSAWSINAYAGRVATHAQYSCQQDSTTRRGIYGFLAPTFALTTLYNPLNVNPPAGDFFNQRPSIYNGVVSYGLRPNYVTINVSRLALQNDTTGATTLRSISTIPHTATFGLMRNGTQLFTLLEQTPTTRSYNTIAHFDSNTPDHVLIAAAAYLVNVSCLDEAGTEGWREINWTPEQYATNLTITVNTRVNPTTFQPVPRAEVRIHYPETQDRVAFTNISGQARLEEIPGVTLFISARKEGYDTLTTGPTLLDAGERTITLTLINASCHADCTDYYNRCNPQCQGLNFTTATGWDVCHFYDTKAMDLCAYKTKGTDVTYEASGNQKLVVTCCEGPPTIEQTPPVSISGTPENLYKLTWLTSYQGKPVTINILTWK